MALGTPPRPQVTIQTLRFYLTCDLWWQYRTWTSAQSPASVRPWTQTWSLAAARSGCHHCPKWQCRHLRPQWECGAQTSSSRVCMAVDVNRSLRNQHRPWLQSGHGPRLGLQLQLSLANFLNGSLKLFFSQVLYIVWILIL